MSKIVRLGDKSSHGGTMVTANANFKCEGVRVCIDQDLHQCPIKGHGTTPVTATSTFKSSGSPVVKTGDSAGCGATMVEGSSSSST